MLRFPSPCTMSPIHTYCSLPSCREARNETAPSYLLPTTRSRSHYRSKMQDDNRPSNSSNQLATRLYIMPILDYSETIFLDSITRTPSLSNTSCITLVSFYLTFRATVAMSHDDFDTAGPGQRQRDVMADSSTSFMATGRVLRSEALKRYVEWISITPGAIISAQRISSVRLLLQPTCTARRGYLPSARRENPSQTEESFHDEA
jgi:hypothetical protein